MVGGSKKIVRNEFNLCCKGGDPRIYDNSIFPAKNMYPKILKGFSLNLSFKFFEHLCFEFEFEYFANVLQISNKVI